MRTAARIALVLTTTTALAVACGGWGSALSAPAYAPTTALLVATTGAQRLPALGPADADAVLLGTQVLPEGLAVPRGATPTGDAHAFVDGPLRGWEIAVDLDTVPVHDALAALRADLGAHGFTLRAGSRDVFAARQREGRWEIVVARVATHGRGDRARDVLTLGVGSRPL